MSEHLYPLQLDLMDLTDRFGPPVTDVETSATSGAIETMTVNEQEGHEAAA
ncbi:hypothetical protein [Actomonas aquatica]|uniref:Uncharacterized protein n=1 Tax=Actomonas aquatica TaxID=2866162 RepID=A0ABZ1CCB2_9BACT|nr:hypothetical protein [Opitutus sp. WL0086]WRQ89306.1 hypothetical protein K1X11_007790 [Opitutus sp. WL0086]